MNFRAVFRLHLSGQLLTVSPHCASHARLSLLTRSARISSSVQQPHQFSRKYHAVPVLAPFLRAACCGAALSPCSPFCFDADERREAPADIPSGYAWCRSVPSSAGRRPTRTTSSPVYATATSTPSGHAPAAIPCFAIRRPSGSYRLDQRLILIRNDAVQAVVMVVMGALVVRRITPAGCGPSSVSLPYSSVNIVRILRDAVIRPHCEGTVRGYRPAAGCRRVRGIRDDVRPCEVHALQPPAVLGRIRVCRGPLMRTSRRCHSTVVTVIHRAVQVLAL
ncbi:hypothetical protein BANRA_01056 [Escherichia coli]|nr:hypothetical protein BANRA_01056 [Escherichia coli]